MLTVMSQTGKAIFPYDEFSFYISTRDSKYRINAYGINGYKVEYTVAIYTNEETAITELKELALYAIKLKLIPNDNKPKKPEAYIFQFKKDPNVN